MSRFRHRSPRLRYLRARLSIFARPSFLVAVAFLSALGFVVKEYWTNPDFLKFALNQQAPSQTSSSSELLSDEDRAIAADIDNLSVLDYDKQQANIPITPNINDGKKIRQQNEAQLNKILDLAQKNQKANQIKPNTPKSQTSNTLSTSQQNPFLKQAEDLLKFKLDSGNTNGNVNNLSPFSTDSQTSGNSFNLGINDGNSTTPESALQKAINESNNKKQESSANNNSTDKNTLGESPQNAQRSASPNSSTNQNPLLNQTDSLVNTNLFNQPLNNQPQNPSANNNNQFPRNNFNNFTQPANSNPSQNPNANNNNQFPANNLNSYTQSGLNNQFQNPYGNNNQFPANNFNNYTQPGLNNQVQPYGNNQVPRNYTQTTPYNNFNNNPQQNPYSNFNRNQVPTNRVKNPYNNFNNSQSRVNQYSPQTQTRINNIYNRLINRELPSAANRNTFTAPNNVNTGLQQFNSPYSPQNQIQYPNNGYRY